MGAGILQIAGVPRARDDVRAWFRDADVHFLRKGRTAIRYLCHLLNLSGREVLVPAYNCGAEVDPLIKGGATVRLYRVDETASIDVEDLRNRITSSTRAVYMIHYFGFYQELRAIKELCSERGLYLIEDCALALFSRAGDTKLGTYGDVSIFSLTKSLPVPDGGALVINNPRLAGGKWRLKSTNASTISKELLPLFKSRVLRWTSEHAGTRPLYACLLGLLNRKRMAALERESRLSQAKPDITNDQCYNDSLTNRRISGVSGRMLNGFSERSIVAQRRSNFLRYLASFEECKGIVPLFKELPAGVCPLRFPILVSKRDGARARLYRSSIDAGCWWKGYYRGLPWEEFPEACFLKDHVLTLPVHQGLTENDIMYIARRVTEAVT